MYDCFCCDIHWRLLCSPSAACSGSLILSAQNQPLISTTMPNPGSSKRNGECRTSTLNSSLQCFVSPLMQNLNPQLFFSNVLQVPLIKTLNHYPQWVFTMFWSSSIQNLYPLQFLPIFHKSLYTNLKPEQFSTKFWKSSTVLYNLLFVIALKFCWVFCVEFIPQKSDVL